MASDPMIFMSNQRGEKGSFDPSELMQLKLRIEGFKTEEVELNRQISEIKGKLVGLKLENEQLQCFLGSGINDITHDHQVKNDKESKREEIDKLLEVMLARCTIGLLDLQMMNEEIGALKKYEGGAAARQMEVKMGELEDGLWELKAMIVELKSEKSKELCLMEERNNLEKGWGLKLNWNAIVVSFGTVAAALTTLLAWKCKGKGKVKVEEMHIGQ